MRSFDRRVWSLRCSDVRQQLTEQLRCLDARLDGHVTLLGELHEFYRRRSEVELEYSRGLDKLVRQAVSRHKTERLGYLCLHCVSTRNEESARRRRKQGRLKMQDRKMTDKSAGLENAGLENDGQKCNTQNALIDH